MICKPLVAYYDSTQVLKSTENTRILLLPGPSDAETFTINIQVLKSMKKSETVFLQPKGIETEEYYQ